MQPKALAAPFEAAEIDQMEMLARRRVVADHDRLALRDRRAPGIGQRPAERRRRRVGQQGALGSVGKQPALVEPDSKRKSAVEGKSVALRVELGGGAFLEKKKTRKERKNNN